MFDIEEELKKLPAKPGVYLMHDKKDAIIYVGKAISLKNRVRQYFQKSRHVTPKIEKMISQIDHFEYIITDSEVEALVLECNLIKEYSPRYNTMLKDDKGYPYIKATTGEMYPRLLYAHKRGKDKCKYFGPYTSSGAAKDTLDLARKIYQIRSCRRNLPRDIGKGKPCLNYHINQCKAPCQGKVTPEEYMEDFAKAVSLLEGNDTEVLAYLKERMLAASAAMDFEEAARYRDLMKSVEHTSIRQKINASKKEDRDVIALAKAGDEAVVQVFFVREGKLLGREHFHVSGVEQMEGEQVQLDFIKQYYAGTPYFPKELVVEYPLLEEELICEWLSGKRGQKVTAVCPQKGEKRRLVELAHKNAATVLIQDGEKIKREEERTVGAMGEIAGWMGLEGVSRVESYDISNISGFQSVGSMVVFVDGKPRKSDYRKFRIKTVQGPDDYSSMREVLMRRFQHGLAEREQMDGQEDAQSYGSFTRFPDLIMMDGGKGQVHVAEEVLGELGIGIPVCGMVKDDNHRTRGIFFQEEELPIPLQGEGFKLMTRIQDETHRFAIEFHRSLRSKEQVKSILNDIPGIGDARRIQLMRHFKSLERIREAEVEEIAAVPSMNQRSAQSVYDYFREKKNKV